MIAEKENDMSTTPRTITQMKNRPTSYEVVVKTEAVEIRLGFTERKNKHGLLTQARWNGQTILPLIGDWDDEATYSKSQGWTFGPARVCFSGRTERDCTTEV